MKRMPNTNKSSSFIRENFYTIDICREALANTNEENNGRKNESESEIML